MRTTPTAAPGQSSRRGGFRPLSARGVAQFAVVCLGA